MKNKLLDALEKKYRGEIALAVANIDVYVTNPVGIGEHSDLTGAIEEQLEKLAHADEMLEVMGKYLGSSE